MCCRGTQLQRYSARRKLCACATWQSSLKVMMTECNFSFYKEMCLLLIKTKHTFKVIEMASFEVAEWVWWVWSRDFLHNLVWPLEQCCSRNSCITLLHNFQTVFWTFFKPHLLPSHRELLKNKDNLLPKELEATMTTEFATHADHKSHKEQRW